MTPTGSEWRLVDGVATAWFETASLSDGAALAARVTAVSAEVSVDVRASGVRIRLGSPSSVEAASAAAGELGLTAGPEALQQVGLVIETAERDAVGRFWQGVLDYSAADGGGLADPWRRDPAIRLHESTLPRPLRNRIHLDVVRPAAVVERLGLGDGGGPYGVRHADLEGTEVDLVPGDPLGEEPETADWAVVFGAMACYRVDSAAQQAELATAAAALAADAGFPLLVDLRPGLVILDSGKDQADADAHGLDLDFAVLAASLQTAARDLGAVADPALPRFVQVFLDAADVDTVRAFWLSALGYVPDRRPGVSDIIDPRRLDPVLVFQQLETSDTARREQRNRLHLELAVPADLLATRVAAALAAGGRPLGESDGRSRVADPEGNELVLVGRG